MKRYDWLERIIKQRGYTDIVQVGTGKGRTSMHLLPNLPFIRLHEIAFYPNDGTGQSSTLRHKKMWQNRIKDYKKQVKIYEGKSEQRVKDFLLRSVDLVFIDADHSYEACKLDCQLWEPIVRRGGLLCGHDYKHPRFPGVEKAVDELFGERVQDFSEHDHVWAVEVG